MIFPWDWKYSTTGIVSSWYPFSLLITDSRLSSTLAAVVSWPRTRVRLIISFSEHLRNIAQWHSKFFISIPQLLEPSKSRCSTYGLCYPEGFTLLASNNSPWDTILGNPSNNTHRFPVASTPANIPLQRYFQIISHGSSLPSFIVCSMIRPSSEPRAISWRRTSPIETCTTKLKSGSERIFLQIVPFPEPGPPVRYCNRILVIVNDNDRQTKWVW